jgi:hypothetical protein
LPAANKYPYLWPEVTAFTNVDALYFKFKTSGVKQGHLDPVPEHYPRSKFQQEAQLQSILDCLEPLEIEEYAGVSPPVFVQDHAFTGVEVDVDHDFDDDGAEDERHVAPDLDGDTFDEFKIYVVKMGRGDQPQCGQPMTTHLRFETNLSYFQPNRTRCYQQYDDSGVGEDDHVKFHAFFDTPFVLDWNYCNSHPCHYSVFDEPDGDGWLNGVPMLQGYFVNNVRMGMWEDDNGPDFLFDTEEVPTLHPWFENLKTHHSIEDNPNPDKADYTYKMWYSVCREKAGCHP